MSRRDVSCKLDIVIMDGRGLVDPQNKPFGRVLPIEVQIRIMFWVECIFTNEKRRKVNKELKGLPKCDLTGFPQTLGEDRRWNQVVVRLHAPRRNGCHHCHRMMDHRMSVSVLKGHAIIFDTHLLLMTLTLKIFFFLVTDWYDGGDGSCPPEPGQPHERGHRLYH